MDEIAPEPLGRFGGYCTASGVYTCPLTLIIVMFAACDVQVRLHVIDVGLRIIRTICLTGHTLMPTCTVTGMETISQIGSYVGAR